MQWIVLQRCKSNVPFRLAIWQFRLSGHMQLFGNLSCKFMYWRRSVMTDLVDSARPPVIIAFTILTMDVVTALEPMVMRGERCGKEVGNWEERRQWIVWDKGYGWRWRDGGLCGRHAVRWFNLTDFHCQCMRTYWDANLVNRFKEEYILGMFKFWTILCGVLA